MAMCPFSEQLGAYHDGELDAQRRAVIDRHLGGCSPCAGELAELQALSGMFASFQPSSLSQMGRHRIHKAVASTMDVGLIRFAEILSTIAASVLIIGTSWLMNSKEPVTTAAAPTAPPWVEVATATEATAPESSTPAAAWYLADASVRADSVRSDDVPQ